MTSLAKFFFNQINCTKNIMKTTKNRRKPGTIIQQDDLEIGQFYAVHGLKNDSEEAVPIAGMAFKLTAMNLPFLVGKLAYDPSHAPVTFDARFLTFMKITDDYVTAQRPETPA